MKPLLIILSMLLFISCSKTMDIPFAPTATDRHVSAPTTPSLPTLVYTQHYQGTADASYNVAFPPFKPISGNLSYWKINVSRRIYGTATFINQLNTRNDSTINVLRYSQFNVADTVYAIWPESCTNRLKNNESKLETRIVPINITLNDSLSSLTYLNFLNVYSLETPEVDIAIRDLVTVFKPNTITTSNLLDSTTVTLTYVYLNN